MNHVPTPEWSTYRSWLGDAWMNDGDPKPVAPEIARLSTDSRSLRPGEWFVPISGTNFDGHKFIDDAIGRGAAGFFYDVDRRDSLSPELVPLGLAVTSSLKAFQRAACGWRLQLQQLKILALTGSAGKTTTKEMLGAILAQAGPTLATQGSFNNEIGVPKTLQRLGPEHRYAALEFGARMPGNIRFLCELGQPDVVALINVGTAHLGIFGSIEALLNTKLEIFRSSSKRAVQVAYADDPRIVQAARATGKKTITFGSTPAADVQLLRSDWHPKDGSMTVHLALKGFAQEANGPSTLAIPFGVAHTVFPINAAAAAAMALAAGIKSESIVAGLTGFRGIKGRYQILRFGRLTVVDDTYNANPESMVAGLSTLARAFPSQRKLLILGDMLELGPESPMEHYRVGQKAVAPLAPALLLTVGKQAEEIAQGALEAGLPRQSIHSFSSVDDLLPVFGTFADSVDVAYAKGSNGLKLGRLIDHLFATKPETTSEKQ